MYKSVYVHMHVHVYIEGQYLYVECVKLLNHFTLYILTDIFTGGMEEQNRESEEGL